MLGHLRKNLNTYATNLFYKSLIVPKFDYYDSVRACCNEGDIDRLERLQKWAARILAKHIPVILL